MKTKRLRFIALTMSILCALTMVSFSAVAASEIGERNTGTEQTESIYPSIDISSITGEGGNPKEISSEASALATEKQWYEYITYSPQAVATYKLSENRRLIFYDPYSYDNSMIMEVVGQDSDWSSANSIDVSYTKGETYSGGQSESNEASSSIEVAEGNDMSYGYSSDVSTSNTREWTAGLSTTAGGEVTSTVGTEASTSLTYDHGLPGFSAEAGASVSAELSTSVSLDVEVSASTGGSETLATCESQTMGWTTVANRISKSTGSSFSTNKEWSSETSTTVTRTFHAAYFNESGSPLQWKIIRYVVYMPMKYELQCKIDGEWVSTDSSYCILTTMEGTCRAWMENNTAYFEHWGTGEKVVWNDFWGTFFTKEKLLEAYKNKLYPDA